MLTGYLAGALLSSNMTQFTAILDTGTAQSQLPSAVQWGYYGGIPGSTADAPPGSGWDTPQGYPCSVNTSLPDLVLL
jgi:hypothetical protein